MRVLLVADWHPGQGGTEAYVGWMRSGLRAAGDEVRLLTSSAGSAADGTADYVAYGTQRVAAQVVLQIANPFAFQRVSSAVASFRPDVVFINMFAYHLSPVIFYAMGGVPIVLAMHDYKCICPIGSKLQPGGSICGVQSGWVCRSAGCVSFPHWIRDQPRYALLRAGVARARKVVTCSELVRRELEMAGIASDCVQLPVPLPSENYRRDPASHPSFLYCGRLEIEKGVEQLLRAFARVRVESPLSTLRIAGRGSQQARLEQLARELHITNSVTFAGWLEPDEIEGELARAWALVAPSLYAEPFGLVVPEAIVREVPVIASAVGGFAETVEEGVSGLLVPNGDVELLAERMLDIAEGRRFPEKRIAKAAVMRASEAHHLGRHVERMRGIFAQIVH